MPHHNSTWTLGCELLALLQELKQASERSYRLSLVSQFPLRLLDSQILINKANQVVPSPRTFSVFFSLFIRLWMSVV